MVVSLNVHHLFQAARQSKTYQKAVFAHEGPTSVRWLCRSMSTTSPLIGNMVTLSGLATEYHTHRLLRLCATITSEPGTHCTYWQ